jgi:hypothetical protein
VDIILTNPPFQKKGLERFIEHGLTLCGRVIILARLSFLESRRPILDSGTWVSVMPMRSRLPMMHRDGWAGRIATQATPFAWFTFSNDHDGSAAIVRRITLPNRRIPH